MLKVAICDDNPTLTEKINTMLFNYNPNIFETYTYYNPLKLVNQLDQENFDFFILDIEMSEMSGIDLAKKNPRTWYFITYRFFDELQRIHGRSLPSTNFWLFIETAYGRSVAPSFGKTETTARKKEITLYFLVTKLLIKYQPKISFISKKIKDKYWFIQLEKSTNPICQRIR